MYSVVLVMALAGSAEAPDCHCFGNMGGCCGVMNNHGCQGNYGGCFGGCNGRGCFGGGCRGGCFGGGCFGGGCYGGGGCNGGYVGGCSGGSYGGAVIVQPKDMPKTETVPAPKKEVQLQTTGTIVVSLPADAKLSIDGYVSQQTTAQRRLVTPAIPQGGTFTYTLVAETTQNGQPVTQSQQVTVRGGQVLPVNFSFPAAPVTTER
jgi:uncharacterized protein (TIGR03000 family)